MKKLGKIFIIAGPTGGGESTITQAIIDRLPKFTRLVTATTRRPRNREKQGVDYYFFSPKKFKQEIASGNIIEHTYIKNRRIYYGSFKPDLEKKLKRGLNIIINPDIVGTKFYKQHYQATTIFIKPDSLESIKQRLLNRDKKISALELSRRLKNAANEIKTQAKFYDFSVINRQNRLDQAINRVIKIINRTLKNQVDKTR